MFCLVGYFRGRHLLLELGRGHHPLDTALRPEAHRQAGIEVRRLEGEATEEGDEARRTTHTFHDRRTLGQPHRPDGDDGLDPTHDRRRGPRPEGEDQWGEVQGGDGDEAQVTVPGAATVEAGADQGAGLEAEADMEGDGDMAR